MLNFTSAAPSGIEVMAYGWDPSRGGSRNLVHPYVRISEEGGSNCAASCSACRMPRYILHMQGLCEWYLPMFPQQLQIQNGEREESIPDSYVQGEMQQVSLFLSPLSRVDRNRNTGESPLGFYIGDGYTSELPQRGSFHGGKSPRAGQWRTDPGEGAAAFPIGHNDAGRY